MRRGDGHLEADLVVPGTGGAVNDQRRPRPGRLTPDLAGLNDTLGTHAERVDTTAKDVSFDQVGDVLVVDGTAPIQQDVTLGSEFGGSRSDRPDLGGVESPEADAEVSEWLTRAVTEYGVAGDPIAEDKLEALDAHLKSRTFVANVSYRATVADLVTYGCVRDAVGALSEDKRTQFVNLARWCDHVGGAYGGDDIFGKLPIKHAENPDILAVFRAMNTSTAADKKLKERGGADGPTKQEQRDAKRKGAGTFADDAKPGAGADDKKSAAPATAGEGKKKEKKEKKEKAPKEPPAKKEVDVSVLDIRVGTIVKCWEHPGADKLWVEEIDVGEDKPRQVVSGLRAFKTSEQMTNARVLCLCNVKKGPLREQMSEGMVMCASNEDHTTVDFVVPPEGALNGERVTFAGYEGEPVEVLVPKKKMFEACAPKLRTNADGVACYDGVPFMTSAGPCASSLKEAFIK